MWDIVARVVKEDCDEGGFEVASRLEEAYSVVERGVPITPKICTKKQQITSHTNASITNIIVHVDIGLGL